MQLTLEPGNYVVAVSGGVDSMALLHMLAQRPQPAYRFTVAHFDHGIRTDSRQDRLLVQQLAADYSLPFIYHEGQLGSETSEAAARQARYDFLRQVQHASGARALITAHHQDDNLETVILNILRGTGRKGFSSLKSTDDIKRPVLQLTKQDLKQYATNNQLVWREDSTNQDRKYFRNYVRHQIIPQLTAEQRQQLLGLIQQMHQVNEEIDHHLLTHLHVQPAIDELDRQHFIMLPHAVGLELLAAWLRRQGTRSFDRKTLQRLSLAAKTWRPGRLADVNLSQQLLIGRDSVRLVPRS